MQHTYTHTFLLLAFHCAENRAKMESIVHCGYAYSCDDGNGYTVTATKHLTSIFCVENACSVLVNCNARLYDPAVGRFLSPDPFVQAPLFSQSYNRYTYCRNNPLKYTDPDGEIVISFISGFIRGLVQGENPVAMGMRTAVNTVKIVAGLLYVDFSQPINMWGSQLISRFTRELPQTLLGFFVAYGSNLLWQVDDVGFYGGATVSSGNFWGQGDGSAIALGSFITGGRNLSANPNNPLFQHEFGHVLQSRAMGWRYLFRVGIPSIRSARRDPANHRYQSFEMDANRRAYTYFHRRLGSNFTWDYDSFPIDADWLRDFHRNRTPFIDSIMPTQSHTAIRSSTNFNWSIFETSIIHETDAHWQNGANHKQTSVDRLRRALSLRR